ncbi:MAG: hypothetical protein R3B55_00825 [Candidatus Paceibacterota bacterium]
MEYALNKNKQEKKYLIEAGDEEKAKDIDFNIENLSEKIQNAKESLILLKRGFTFRQIKQLGEKERQEAIDKVLPAGMFFEKSQTVNNDVEKENSREFEAPETRESIENKISILNKEYKIAADKGDIEGANKIDEEIHELEQKLVELSSGKVTVNQSEPNQEGAKKTIQDLGYSSEDLEKIKYGEDLQKIFKEQIYRDEWFKDPKNQRGASSGLDTEGWGEETKEVAKERPDTVIDFSNGRTKGRMTIERGAKNPDVSTEARIEEIDKEIARAENIVLQLDGSESAKPFVNGQKALIKELKEEKSNIEKLLVEVPAQENPTNVISQEKTEKTEEKNTEEASQVYEKNKDFLASLGWNLQEYLALSEEERDHVLWKGIKEENYSRNKKEELEVKETTPVYVEEDLGKQISDFAKSIFDRKSETGEIKLSDEEGKFFSKYKEKIQEELNSLLVEDKRINKEKEELGKKGVSPGAKEFIKSEKKSFDLEKERQESTKAELERRKKLSEALERGYENLSKEELIRIAKERGLASGADKQVLIDKIIEDDLNKNKDNFGFSTPEISDKLREFNISEKQMALISPEFSLFLQKSKDISFQK